MNLPEMPRMFSLAKAMRFLYIDHYQEEAPIKRREELN